MFGDVTPQADNIQEITIAYLVLSLLQIADQAKIIHWQADTDREHRHFGMFYDTFIGQMDILVEAIAGKYGKDKLNFQEAAIMVYDRSIAKEDFFNLVDETLSINFSQVFDRENDSELYNLIDEILDLKNKTQYLLQFNP